MDLLSYIISYLFSTGTAQPPRSFESTRPIIIQVTKLNNAGRVVTFVQTPPKQPTVKTTSVPKTTKPVVAKPAPISTKPTTTAVTTPTAPSTPATTPISVTSGGIFTLTNSARTDNGLFSLKRNTILDKIAQARAEDMLKGQYFAHTSPTGESFSTLADVYGYSYRRIGENIARGTFKTSDAIVDGWMNSPGHRANILKADYTEIGIGLVYGEFNGLKQWIAVQVFGTSR